MPEEKKESVSAIISMPLCDGALLYVEIRPAEGRILGPEHLEAASRATQLVAEIFGKIDAVNQEMRDQALREETTLSEPLSGRR